MSGPVTLTLLVANSTRRVSCSTRGCSRLLLVASHWNTAPFSFSLTTRLIQNKFKTLYSHTTKGLIL